MEGARVAPHYSIATSGRAAYTPNDFSIRAADKRPGSEPCSRHDLWFGRDPFGVAALTVLRSERTAYSGRVRTRNTALLSPHLRPARLARVAVAERYCAPGVPFSPRVSC